MNNTLPYRSFVASASRLLDFANQYILRELDAIGVNDLHPSHGDILAQLFAQDGLTVTELAARTQRSKSTVSVLVDRLCESGYLAKWRLPTDQRAITVRLTQKAWQLEPQFKKISESLNRRLTRALSEEEADTLETLLTRMTESFAPSKTSKP